MPPDTTGPTIWGSQWWLSNKTGRQRLMDYLRNKRLLGCWRLFCRKRRSVRTPKSIVMQETRWAVPLLFVSAKLQFSSPQWHWTTDFIWGSGDHISCIHWYIWGLFHNDVEWQPFGLWCGNGYRPAIAAGAYRGYEPIQVSSLQSS